MTKLKIRLEGEHNEVLFESPTAVTLSDGTARQSPHTKVAMRVMDVMVARHAMINQRHAR
jgi:hypothetical protein